MVWYANAWIKVCKIRMFFLISAGFFPEYFVAIVINVYRARKNEQVVAKAVYVSQNVCLHGSGVRQRYYVAFGASCDCPRDIGPRGVGVASGEDEPVVSWQVGVEAVDCGFEVFHHAVGHGSRLPDGFRFCGQGGADIEESVHGIGEHLVLLRRDGGGAVQEAEPGS